MLLLKQAMSEGVRQGTLRCVLRAICTAANNTYFKAAFKQAEAPAKIQVSSTPSRVYSIDLLETRNSHSIRVLCK